MIKDRLVVIDHRRARHAPINHFPQARVAVLRSKDPVAVVVVEIHRIPVVDRSELFPRPAHLARHLVARVARVQGAAFPGTEHEGRGGDWGEGVEDLFDFGHADGLVFVEREESLLGAGRRPVFF